MPSRRTLGFIVLILILGAAVGTLLGDLIGLVLPEGVVREFFVRSWTLEIGPGTLNASLFSVTLGLTFKLNAVGIIGIGFAVYLLRWVLD